jgi:hypothetical protein
MLICSPVNTNLNCMKHQYPPEQLKIKKPGTSEDVGVGSLESLIWWECEIIQNVGKHFYNFL